MIAVVAGLTGAAVAVTTVALSGGLRTRVIEHQNPIQPAVATTPTTAPSAKTVRRLVTDTAAVVAGIDVQVGSTRRRGSGLVVRADGVLVTSEALVRSADRVVVTFADGRAEEGTVAGRDPATGVAVVRVTRTGLTVARFDARTPQPGDPAVLVAGPPEQGQEPWVSPGVVSSVNRLVAGHGTTLAGLIETDRPVPQIADGGALVAEDGTVQGLGLQLSSADDPDAGYAVPIAVANSVATDLLAYGRVRLAWLGVEGDDLPDGLARNLAVTGGAVLSSVAPGSPAAAAGLRSSDVVVDVDGNPVASMAGLIEVLHQYRPGQQVVLTVVRGKARATMRVTLAERR